MRDLFARLRGASSSVSVGGNTYKGSEVRVENGVVTVDGRQVANMVGSLKIEVTINGDVELLETGAGDVRVSGSVGNIKTGSGDVQCGGVSGNVTTSSGDVECDSIAGNASSVSGDVGC